jgi:hypothetical protein
MDSHEKYIELCAASTAGELSRDEQQELQQHLAVCASCRRVKHEYEMTVENIVPARARQWLDRWTIRVRFLQASPNGAEFPVCQCIRRSEQRAGGPPVHLSAISDSVG